MSAVAVVIPSWNTAAHLGHCLDSLDAQDGVGMVETLAVDNGSTDGSLALIRKRGVRHLSLPANVGFAKAVNLGVASTDAPLILVLNADCFLSPGCLRALVAELSADRRLGGVQPRILQDAAGEAVNCIYSAGQCLTRYGRAFERGWGEPDGPPYRSRDEVFGVSGAACLLRRELFADLGGYDEAYFAFFEDVDLNARARLAGWSFAYVPEAVALHVGHAAWGRARQAQRFNVELTVRNRLATAVKVLPVSGVAGAVGLTMRSVAAGPLRGSGSAALAGAVSALTWLPRLLRERRRLRRGSTSALDGWLSAAPAPGPDPRRAQGAAG
ncbi:MAG TPA: glycosyltransferase family 2 protein [Solirubrobacteraceae bacterium]|nr:glycosyltransferase family 2 protein [Solirubrobacteraceae bacterium]